MFKLDLKGNAIDSLNESFLKFKKGQEGEVREFKFSILHLTHALELILKMYLRQYDESLVFCSSYKILKRKEKEEGVSRLEALKRLLEGGGTFPEVRDNDRNRTVRVQDVLDLVKEEFCTKTGVRFIDEEFIEDIQSMKSIRNSIEHFEFDFNVKEVRLITGRLVRGLMWFTECFDVLDLEAELKPEVVEVFRVLADEYEQAKNEALMSVAEAEKEAFRGVRPKFYNLIDWRVYQCPECKEETMIKEEGALHGYRCQISTCGNEESDEIEIECYACGGLWPNGDMWNIAEDEDPESITSICPNCSGG